MWILECDGTLLRGKRLWLKPGSTRLFGRTRGHSEFGSLDERNYVIENKSVSRKHLVIKVAPVQNGEGSNLETRSKLTISDDSRVGTYLDGQKFLKESRTLTNNEHEIKLATYEQKFRIKWQPVVLSFTLPEKRQTKDRILQKPQSQLEPFDVKTILPYVPNDTTHVVASKRNTAKGLQALINGKHIVTEEYIDAIIKAAVAPPNVEAPDIPLPSPLEEDYDANWPNALQFVPAEGKEPIPRPSKLFAPNSDRKNVFSGFSFVFLDQHQIDNLRDPINNGGGRAFLYEVKRGVTTTSEIVQFVKGLADEKGIDPFQGQGKDNAVVVVRFSGKKRTEDWDVKFMSSVDLALSQRSIEQNEFLDAIVVNDASTLRKPLQVEVEPPVAGEVPEDSSTVVRTVEHDDGRANKSADKNPSKSSIASRLRVRRGVTESRFKGFDDFDESQLSYPKIDEEQSPEAQEGSTEPMDTVTAQSQSLFVGDSQPTAPSRKRRSPPSEDSVHAEDLVDQILPATAAMKRRKLEEGSSPPPPPNTTQKAAAEEAAKSFQSPQKQKKGRKKGQEPDILYLARERREAEEEAARQDAQSLERALEGMDIETIRNLIQVEEMEVLSQNRNHEARNEQAEMPDRWSDKWNGRKNFKKFRRRGEVQAMRGQRVIVGLEEVKKKDFGIGEEYWLEGSTQQQTATGTTQSRNTQREQGSSLQENSRRTDGSPRNNEASGPNVIDITSTEETGSTGPSGRRTRASVRSAPNDTISTGLAAAASASTVVDSQLGRSVIGKRSAAEAPQPEGRTAKRQRMPLSRMENEDDDDDGSDDGLKFRFRRKR